MATQELFPTLFTVYSDNSDRCCLLDVFLASLMVFYVESTKTASLPPLPYAIRRCSNFPKWLLEHIIWGVVSRTNKALGFTSWFNYYSLNHYPPAIRHSRGYINILVLMHNIHMVPTYLISS